MDRFEEMEGDLDDIDEDKERDKVTMLSSSSKLVVQPFLSSWEELLKGWPWMKIRQTSNCSKTGQTSFNEPIYKIANDLKFAGFWRMVISTLITRGKDSSSGLVSTIE